MLYIKDLRGLQTIVDETLVNVQVRCSSYATLCSVEVYFHSQAGIIHVMCSLQNYTANPKTDAALGRIGR